jgi:biopolymer transport protein ExbB/TolQ
MNDLLGAVLLTTIMLFALSFYVVKNRKRSVPRQIVSQAMLHHRYAGAKKYKRKMKAKTQSAKHQDDSTTKVIVVDDEAYWIKNNTFYKAPLVNERIDKDSAERVDTSNMDKVQLDKMLFIVDKLTEGTSDDSRGSGNA